MDASARHYSSYFSAIGCNLSLDSIRLAVVFLFPSYTPSS